MMLFYRSLAYCGRVRLATTTRILSRGELTMMQEWEDKSGKDGGTEWFAIVYAVVMMLLTVAFTVLQYVR
jgi:hypothetical protein